MWCLLATIIFTIFEWRNILRKLVLLLVMTIMASFGSINCSTIAQADTQSISDSQVADLTGETLSSFPEYSCAVTAHGNVKCWGNLAGYGIPNDLGVSNAIQVAAGVRLCVLFSDGTLECYGSFQGSDPQMWVQPKGLKNLIQIYAGDGICGVDNLGKIFCWGYNYNNNSYVPADIAPAAAVAVGSLSTCAVLKTSHLVRCWSGGQLTYDVDTRRIYLKQLSFSAPSNLGPVKQLSVVRDNAYCALKEDDSVYCWSGPQASSGNLDNYQPPGKYAYLTAGYWNGCGIDFEQKINCWGNNLYKVFPSDAGGFQKVLDFTSNEGYSCAIKDTKELICFGEGYKSFDNLDGGKPTSIDLLVPSGRFRNLSQAMEPGNVSIQGNVSVSETISAITSNWLPEVSQTFQWLRDGVPISGATSGFYTLIDEDYLARISVQVSVSKTGYLSISKTSVEYFVGAGSLIKTPVPAVSDTPGVAGLLTLNTGVWDSGVSFQYQWLRDGVAIPAATSSSYTLQASDYLKKISVAVTGAKEGYISETKTSDAVIPVKPKEKIASLRFTGSFKVGEKAYVGPSNRNGKFDYSYQWLRDGVEITGATSRTYLLGSEDLGSNLSARVCALYLKDVSHCVSQDAGSAVQLGLLKNVKASISGVAKVGRMLNSTPVIFDKQATVAYQWLRNGEPILDATRNSYFIDLLDKGSSISLRVTVTKPGYETEVKTSSSKSIN
jgi:hypothetical protein